MAVVDDLLFPLAPQSGVDRVGRAGDVLGVDVPADTQRVEVAQAPLARATQPVRQEVAVVVTKDDVGDDLRFGRILLDLAAGPEPGVRAHPREQLVEARRPKAGPLAAAKQRVPRNDQDILARAHRLSLAMRCAGGVSRDDCDSRGRREASAPAPASRPPAAPGLDWPAR